MPRDGHVIECFLTYSHQLTTQHYPTNCGRSDEVFLSIFLLSTAMAAQSFKWRPAVPRCRCASQRPFWTVENRVSVRHLGRTKLVAADAFTTQRGLNQGSEKSIPVMRPFVTRGAPGEAVGSALGFGGGVLTSCTFASKAPLQSGTYYDATDCCAVSWVRRQQHHCDSVTVGVPTRIRTRGIAFRRGPTTL